VSGGVAEVGSVVASSSHTASASPATAAPWRPRAPRRPEGGGTAEVEGDGCGVDLHAWSSPQVNVNARLRRGSASPGPACAHHERGVETAEASSEGMGGAAVAGRPLAARVAAAALRRRRCAAATVPADGHDGARSRICLLRLEKAAQRGGEGGPAVEEKRPDEGGEGSWRGVFLVYHRGGADGWFADEGIPRVCCDAPSF
jgi:hypothetical protein